MTVEEKIQHLLTERLKPSGLIIKNDSSKHAGHSHVEDKENSHFAVTIISNEFIGKTRVQRHQMIYECLHDLMDHPIHALVIHAHTPEEKG